MFEYFFIFLLFSNSKAHFHADSTLNDETRKLHFEKFCFLFLLHENRFVFFFCLLLYFASICCCIVSCNEEIGRFKKCLCFFWLSILNNVTTKSSAVTRLSFKLFKFKPKSTLKLNGCWAQKIILISVFERCKFFVLKVLRCYKRN